MPFIASPWPPPRTAGRRRGGLHARLLWLRHVFLVRDGQARVASGSPPASRRRPSRPSRFRLDALVLQLAHDRRASSAARPGRGQQAAAPDLEDLHCEEPRDRGGSGPGEKRVLNLVMPRADGVHSPMDRLTDLQAYVPRSAHYVRMIQKLKAGTRRRARSGVENSLKQRRYPRLVDIQLL